MSKRVVIATVRCDVDYDALMSALARARSPVLCQYHARSRTYDKYGWLDEKAEEAETVSKLRAAVSVMCAAHSLHASALFHSIVHISMLTQGLNKCQA